MDVEKILYIHSDALISHCNKLPTFKNRASIVQDLINSYNLMNNPKLLAVKSKDANEDELKYFHSSTYVDFLKRAQELDDSADFENEELEYGLNYDCPILENMYDFVKTVGGSSLTAAKVLNLRKCKVAINWFGGWHHAQRDSAEGFCYVNDIVIAIQKLTEKFNKIIYIDLDIHHGDGVQNAFEFSKKILTMSFHRYDCGFYPGTGDIQDIGSLEGQYYSLNVPLFEGLSDETFLKIFLELVPRVFDAFKPAAIVVQCGADGLHGDPVGQCNLTLNSYGKCVEEILSYNLPTLFVGGGGYNFANTARLWTYLTALILDQKIENDIPDDSEYFTDYAPSYELQIEPGNQKDCNTVNYVNEVINTVLEYCKFIKSE